MSEWISIDDSRTDYAEGNKVLGFGSGYVFEAECEGGYWTNLGGEDMTHWMPLPEPPKASIKTIHGIASGANPPEPPKE
tara:strand:+ start:430 stop:666 length:237 start_codon:yes stop_codon:yes gene_type:complete